MEADLEEVELGGEEDGVPDLGEGARVSRLPAVEGTDVCIKGEAFGVIVGEDVVRA